MDANIMSETSIQQSLLERQETILHQNPNDPTHQWYQHFEWHQERLSKAPQQPYVHCAQAESFELSPTATFSEPKTPNHFSRLPCGSTVVTDDDLQPTFLFPDTSLRQYGHGSGRMSGTGMNSYEIPPEVMLPRLDRRRSNSSFGQTYDSAPGVVLSHTYGIESYSRQEVASTSDGVLLSRSAEDADFHASWPSDSLSDVRDQASQPGSNLSSRPESPVSHGSKFSANNAETNKEITPTCTNCSTQVTSLWRRNLEGAALCNACGLYSRLHGINRPLSLKTDIVKKRNRSSISDPSPSGKGITRRRATKKYGDTLEKNRVS